MKTKIEDWTGKDVYPGQTFNSVQEASDFLLADQRKRNPKATDDEFDEIIGEFHITEQPEPKQPKTNAELGQIMLDKVGADACQKGYGTTDPYWVGVHALQFCDINQDGTLN